MKTIAKERQTLLDIALQTCGHIETVLALAEANGMSITDRLEDGRVLTVPELLRKRARMICRLALTAASAS